ncbi:unnamed protein product, partial [Discosporangium mesarthrocarpum]
MGGGKAAVDLVGKFILAGDSGLLERYYKALMERLLDKGVSVRKSVVKTLRGVLLADPGHPRRTEMCRALLERVVVVREEDTIRDLIRETFQ